MDYIECYCGTMINPTEGPSHMIACERWQRKSTLFKQAKSLVQQAEGLSLLRIECEALMMFPFEEPVFKLPKIKSKSKPKPDDDDELNKQLIEKLTRENYEPESFITCSFCRSGKPDMTEISFLNCEHIVCNLHILQEARSTYAKTGSVKCPLPSCAYILSRDELLSIIQQEELDSMQPSFQDIIGTSDGCIATCSCGITSWLEPGKPDYSQKDDSGSHISRAHAEHMARYRFRCTCGKISCSKCHAEPYHIGKTCDEQLAFKNAKHCRYCGGAIKGSSRICGSHECKDRLSRSCQKILGCGHQCFGTHDETACVDCLDSECDSRGTDFCTICYVEGLSNAPCVALGCGHIFHYHCINTTLAKRWAGPRITFKFAKCPSCNAWVTTPNHQQLTIEINKISVLFSEIQDKALKRLKFEGKEEEERVKNPADVYFNRPEHYALDRFSYYECFKCKKAYFGGKKGCEDNNDQAKFNPEELVCPSCAAIGMEGADCKVHGKDFIEFKCKFCCSVAAWFCWGTTHFCDSCHTRQNNGDYLSKKARSELPVCPGKTCPLKVGHPANGEEFALGCTLCRNLVANNKDF